MIKRMKPESAISTSSVNRVHKIQKDDKGETDSCIYLDLVFESLGLKISYSFTEFMVLCISKTYPVV